MQYLQCVKIYVVSRERKKINKRNHTTFPANPYLCIILHPLGFSSFDPSSIMVLDGQYPQH